MNDEQHCISDSVLQQLEDDRIPQGTVKNIEAHISTCEACRQIFDNSLRSSDWTDDIRPALSESAEKLSASNETQLGEDASIQADIDRLLGPTDDPHMLGRIGAYEVAGVIGRGGMGIVLKAFDANLDRFVAIKMLAPHLALSGAARQRFVREGKAAAAVVDDHVMPVYAVDEWNGVPYLVMQYTRGRSLQHRLNDQGPLKVEEVLRIGTQVARGLAAAHAQGLVHRDIKPSNILLSESVERALLMDFGLARAVDDASMTRTGTVAGTPQYMSPEQARADTIDQRSDLFSLGSVLYTMCAGRIPFRGESAFAVLKLICDKEPRSVTEINSEIPAWLAQIIDRLMSKTPNDRFASADEVASLLEECLAHVQQPDSAPLPAAFQRSRGNGRWLAKAAQAIRPGTASKSDRNAGGRITKLLAAAAMIPVMIVMGIIIVLEVNKGTLTITSEADNVPIRIMQGDEVVDTMTVSSDGTSVRVSAGRYRIVIDGPADKVTVQDGMVVLQRRGEEVVRIVHEDSVAAELRELSKKFSAFRQFTVDAREGNQSQKKATSLLRRLIKDFSDSKRAAKMATQGKTTVDFYCGENTLSEMSTDGPYKHAYDRLTLRLQEHPAITKNFLVIPEAPKNGILVAVVRYPFGQAPRGPHSTDAASEMARLIQAACDDARVPVFSTTPRDGSAIEYFSKDGASAGNPDTEVARAVESTSLTDTDSTSFFATEQSSGPGNTETATANEMGSFGLLERIRNNHRDLARDKKALDKGHIIVDFYCGDDTLPQMNTDGEFRRQYNQMMLDLQEISGVTMNFRAVPRAVKKNQILVAVIRASAEAGNERVGRTEKVIRGAGIDVVHQGTRNVLVQGKVIASRRSLVEVTLGTDDGIRSGMQLTVIRGSQFIGMLRVVSVDLDSCVASMDAGEGVRKADSVLASVSPSVAKSVTLEPHQTAMVILSHPAELRNGNSIQQAAISVAIGQLSSADYCGVLNYTPKGVQWLWNDDHGSGVVQLSDRRPEFMKALSQSRPGDFPTFDPALKMALAALRECSAKSKHLLVLTDGDPSLEDESLLAEFRESGIIISVVHADLHGEPYYRIPILMAKKTKGAYWVLPSDAPSASFEALFRDATRNAIRSMESSQPQNRVSHPQAPNRSATSPWPSEGVQSWAWNNGNSLTTVSINSPSISGTFQGWITDDRKHVVIPSHFIDDQVETEIEVRTADGKIRDASIVESRGHLTLLSVGELPFSGMAMSDKVTVRENEVLYIAGRNSATPVRVLHEAGTTSWSMIPGLRFVDAIVVDTEELNDVDLLHGAAVVTKSGKLAGMIMNVAGRRKPVVRLNHVKELSDQLIAATRDSAGKASNDSTSADESTMQIVAEEGTWKLNDCVTLHIDSRDDKLFGKVYRAILVWSATDSGRPALSYQVDIAGDEHYKWAVAWKAGTSMIWLLAKGNYQSGSSIRSVDYSVPANVVTSVGYGDDRFDLRLPELSKVQAARRHPFSIGSPWERLPKPLDRQLVRHFGLGQPAFGISSLLPTGPHIPSGQYAESAVVKDGWKFHGTVTNNDGKPRTGVRVFATTWLSRTVKLSEAVSDARGKYELVVRPDLMTFANSRRIVLQAEQENVVTFLPSDAQFDLRLAEDEEPQDLLDAVRSEVHEHRSHLPKSQSIHTEVRREKHSRPTAIQGTETQADFRESGLKDGLHPSSTK